MRGALAEDVTQATFTALWRRARQGRVDGARGVSVRPILYAMARNECSNALRGTRRHRELVTRVGAQPSPETTDNVSEWVRAEQTMAEIRAGLDSLPPRQRDVVELVSWAGLTEAEAADVLDVPVGTVKSRLARARRNLAALRDVSATDELERTGEL